MSYRAFKRLLGETSLERKCRFLFGAGILVLIALSFWFYGYKTEHLAYDQALASCRLLVRPILNERHLQYLEPAAEPKMDGRALVQTFADPGRVYQYNFLQEGRFDDAYESNLY